MCEQEKETYPEFREKVRSIKGVVSVLRKHQSMQITVDHVLGAVRDMLNVVKEELSGPAKFDAGIDVSDIEEVEDNGSKAKRVSLRLVASFNEAGLGKDPLLIVASSPRQGADYIIQYYLSSTEPGRRERRKPYSTAEILAEGVLEDEIAEFLKWYTEGCPPFND